jgi:lipoprotein NlpI
MTRIKFCQAVTVLWLSGCSLPTVPPPTPVLQPATDAAQIPQQPVLSAAQQQQFEQAKQQLSGGDFAAATAILQPLAAQLPKLPGIRYNLALSQWQGGDIAAAQRSLAQLLAGAPQHSDGHNLSGVLARQQGNFRQAERHFQRALQADAKYAVAHKNLAFLYELYLGEPLQAHYHYQQYYALTQDVQTKIWLALLEQELDQLPAQAAKEPDNE